MTWTIEECALFGLSLLIGVPTLGVFAVAIFQAF